MRDKYAALALKHADRLTPRERYYIEGYYYSGRAETVARAIDAYKKCIEIDAGHQACRHNVALIYAELEQYKETVTHYEYLVQRGATNATSFGNLALAYIALGEVDKARALVDAFSKRNPENAAGHISIGVSRLAAGQFEEADSIVRPRTVAGLHANQCPGGARPRAGASGGSRPGRRVMPRPCWPTAPTRHESGLAASRRVNSPSMTAAAPRP